MHYDSPYNSKKRSTDVDLLDIDTRIQSPPVVQVSMPVPVALAGHDPVDTYVRASRAVAPAYDWMGVR